MKVATAIRRLALRIKAVRSELNYAQRRMLEIRTGITIDDDRKGSSR
jgi:hypothetical protein